VSMRSTAFATGWSQLTRRKPIASPAATTGSVPTCRCRKIWRIGASSNSPNIGCSTRSSNCACRSRPRRMTRTAWPSILSRPPPDWPEHFVTAYASTHPWEDFAETWAHYFHMVDTLETANAFGLSVRPRLAKGAALATDIDLDPHNAGIDRIIDAWLPLTFA